MLKDVLPPWVLERKKMGFPTPLAFMFRKELTSYVQSVLLDPATERRGYFNPAAVRKLFDEHVSGREDHHSALWRLIVLEEWHRQFIDASVATAGVRTSADIVTPA